MAAVAHLTDMSDLKDLEPLSQRLTAATQELNQALTTIEERINALGIGVEVWLDDNVFQELERYVEDDEEDSSRRIVHAIELGYGRHGNAWALLARTVKWYEVGIENPTTTPAQVEVITPLLRTSRELRSKAVEQIPGLVDAIRAEAERLIASVESAKRIADALK